MIIERPPEIARQGTLWMKLMADASSVGLATIIVKLLFMEKKLFQSHFKIF